MYILSSTLILEFKHNRIFSTKQEG